MDSEVTIYERTTRNGRVSHAWYVLDKGRAAHLWIRTGPTPDDHYGGIEIHSPTPTHEGHKPRTCHLLIGGKCYHDGTSLGAEPHVYEFVEGRLTDDDAFSVARRFLRDRLPDGDTQ